jgi:hypothetical protein
MRRTPLVSSQGGEAWELGRVVAGGSWLPVCLPFMPPVNIRCMQRACCCRLALHTCLFPHVTHPSTGHVLHPSDPPPQHPPTHPGEEANLWSFNYFFYNKRLKRILYLAARAISKAAAEEAVRGGGGRCGWVGGWVGWGGVGWGGVGWGGVGGVQWWPLLM